MIVLFDGVCNLCSKAIQFILPRDEAGRLKFASLQSEYARSLLETYGLKVQEPAGSIVLFVDGEVFTESTAALRIAGALRFPWNLLRYALIVPRGIRDPIYRLIASNRYHWFGRTEACWLPSPDWQDRFLDT